jgi:leucine dehydrogenase
MLRIKEITIPGYEKVIEGEDPNRGLHCFIAVHSSRLGPSLGGTRIYPYATPKEALDDVLLLAKAMTYKSAVAEDGLGGGKSVIIADPAKEKTPELLHAFAEVIDSLNGQYIAAEDVGSNIADMTLIRQKTPFVAALSTDKSSGDPSRFTAWGVYRGIQAVSKKLWHSKSLKGKTIAIEGLGSVGSKLANILFWEGANLVVCDIKEKLNHQAVHDYAAQVVNPKDFCQVECDILAPCAMGGTINASTVPLLRCKAIAGSANNQLENDEIGKLLLERKILYAPDYIINSGGIINAAAEFDERGYNPTHARDRVNHIYDILMRIFRKSETEHISTNVVADLIAEHNLNRGIGKRKHPIIFK